MATPKTENTDRTIARILKVNHAGEHGAIRIYTGQIRIATLTAPDLCDFLRETRGHEIRHADAFRRAMPARKAHPCRAMWLWGIGGYALGMVTALLGRRAIWICTAAVEARVHRHLAHQLRFLAHRDCELHDIIAGIRDEEEQHLAAARQALGRPRALDRLLDAVIALSTEAVIWLSTNGDSRRMAREIAPNDTAS